MRLLWCQVKEFLEKKEKRRRRTSGGWSFSPWNHAWHQLCFQEWKQSVVLVKFFKNRGKTCGFRYHGDIRRSLDGVQSKHLRSRGCDAQKQSQRSFLWEDKLNHAEGANTSTYRLNNWMWCHYNVMRPPRPRNLLGSLKNMHNSCFLMTSSQFECFFFVPISFLQSFLNHFANFLEWKWREILKWGGREQQTFIYPHGTGVKDLSPPHYKSY